MKAETGGGKRLELGNFGVRGLAEEETREDRKGERKMSIERRRGKRRGEKWGLRLGR